MAKYDWIKLKQEYLLGDHKSINAFLCEKGISRTGSTNKQTAGWDKEKAMRAQDKGNKIIEAVTEQEIQYEIDRNTAHLAAGDAIMFKLNLAIGALKPRDNNALYLLQAAAATLEKVQKTQQLGEGFGIEGQVTIIDDL